MLDIAIIDDDIDIRTEMQRIFHFQADMRCVISSPSCTHFRNNYINIDRIDLIFLDIDMPGESGLDFLPFLRKYLPTAEVIMLTRMEDKDALLRALNLGAMGYLLKDFSFYQLPQYIHILQEGGALISPAMARHLVTYFNPPKQKKNEIELLTSKEQQVLMRLAEGNTYEQVAKLLGLTLNGVRFHVKQVYSKLNVNKREDAIYKWQLNRK